MTQEESSDEEEEEELTEEEKGEIVVNCVSVFLVVLFMQVNK